MRGAIIVMGLLPDIWLGLVSGLAATIRAERNYPTRTHLREKLIDAPGTFDETDPVMLSWLGDAQTPAQRRRKAISVINMMRKGKGPGKLLPRPKGMSAATQCAFIVSVLCEWAPLTREGTQNLCEKLWSAAGGDMTRRGGTRERLDGFWRDHLQEARKWQNTPEARQLNKLIAGR